MKVWPGARRRIVGQLEHVTLRSKSSDLLNCKAEPRVACPLTIKLEVLMARPGRSNTYWGNARGRNSLSAAWVVTRRARGTEVDSCD